MSNFLDLDFIQFLASGTLSNLSSGNSWPYSQGFRDTSLTVWDASTILCNYEVRTGHVLSREELDSGCLANKLVDADYDLTTSVSEYLSLLPQLTTCSSLENNNFKVFVVVRPPLRDSRLFFYDAPAFVISYMGFVRTTNYCLITACTT